jgi:hypothetical protein
MPTLVESRKEEDSHPQAVSARDVATVLRRHLADQASWKLGQETGAIAGQTIGADRTAVGEIR